MRLIIEAILASALFFLICYLQTGTDEKNIKSYRVYPDEIKEKLLKDEQLKGLIKEPNASSIFVSNLLLFGVILFLFGLPLKNEDVHINVLNLLILGQWINAFDYLVIDRIWWRHSTRPRFKAYQNAEWYQDDTYHRQAFLRGIPLFCIIAIVDGIILTFI